jgi:hypothetical protein
MSTCTWLMCVSVYDNRDSIFVSVTSPFPRSSLTLLHRCLGYHKSTWHIMSTSVRLIDVFKIWKTCIKFGSFLHTETTSHGYDCEWTNKDEVATKVWNVVDNKSVTCSYPLAALVSWLDEVATKVWNVVDKKSVKCSYPALVSWGKELRERTKRWNGPDMTNTKRHHHRSCGLAWDNFNNYRLIIRCVRKGDVVTRGRLSRFHRTHNRCRCRSDSWHRGDTHKSMYLKEIPAVNQTGGQGETEKDKQPASQKKKTHTTGQVTMTTPVLLVVSGRSYHCFSSGSHSWWRLVLDLGGWKDNHVEEDFEESQRGFWQDESVCRCPLEQEFLTAPTQRLKS